MSIYAGVAFAVTGGLDVYNFSAGFLSFGVFKVGPIQLETIIAVVIFTVGGLLLNPYGARLACLCHRWQ